MWVGRNQICAIGLAVRKMVSLHGIALNVSTDLDYDRLIIPCGLPDRGITSLSKESGPSTVADVKAERRRLLAFARIRARTLTIVHMAIEIDLIDGPNAPQHVRKPDWLRVSLPIGDDYERVKAKVNALALNTVCKEAACPNIAECWGAGTATIMILGDTCTRGCRFCNVKTGNPKGDVDWLEPVRVAEAVRDLGWKYFVLTAVDRDDLADGGALIFANTIRAIHERVPGSKRRDSQRRLSRRYRRAGHRDGRKTRRFRAQPRNGAPPDARACGTNAQRTISRSRILAHAKAARRSGTRRRR